MSAISRDCPSPQATQALARALAGFARAGDVIALKGDIGAGKTTFSQSFIGALLAAPQDVTSPTFNIVQWYDTSRGFRVCHADLYRLKHEEELQELGLDEAFEQHVSLIEWPEIAKNHLPAGTLHISIEHLTGDARRLTLSSASTAWQERLAALA